MSVGSAFRHHRRSASSTSGTRVNREEPPPPPPRSAPTTFRKRRRDVGDRVFITSPTTILLTYFDDNLKKLQSDLGCDENCGYFSGNICKCNRNRVDDDSKSKKRSNKECSGRSPIKNCDISNTYVNDNSNGGRPNLMPRFPAFRTKKVEKNLELQEINVFIGMTFLYS